MFLVTKNLTSFGLLLVSEAMKTTSLILPSIVLSVATVSAQSLTFLADVIASTTPVDDTTTVTQGSTFDVDIYFELGTGAVDISGLSIGINFDDQILSVQGASSPITAGPFAHGVGSLTDYFLAGGFTTDFQPASEYNPLINSDGLFATVTFLALQPTGVNATEIDLVPFETSATFPNPPNPFGIYGSSAQDGRVFVNPIPEPSALGGLFGLAALMVARRRAA